MEMIRAGEIVERKGVTGVVFSCTFGEHDGDSFLDSVEIRWSDNKLEEIDADDIGETVKVITPKLYVNVYLHDQVYGGPEEGGWWYDSWLIEESLMFETEAEADAEYSNKAKEAGQDNKGRPPISSVCSKGVFEVRLEAWPGESENNNSPWC